ncbi:carbohydrate-binding protein [Glycomyces xiaoerkulensis]|uniref:carbohydrate-binding protein n=1 Tax=Glycomyces xiaoerkulensis TaxID=2038139 RepID=UPI000C25791A|nr:carbohydrate-binding protein [Glycomyces xiaoerkulensis]
MTPDRTRPRWRRIPVRAVAALSAAAAVFAAAALSINTAGAQDLEASQEWEQIWSAEFNGGAGQMPDGNKWRFDIGHGYPGGPANWGTGEIAYHTDDPANISMDGNGNLEITALRDGAGDWTSARIETERGDFRAPEGGSLRIEGRLRLPQVSGEAALGYWPAFWALGSPYRGDYWNWPGVGEFDIMENVNGLGDVHAVLHCGVSEGGPCNETMGIGDTTTCGGDCQDGFHTYAFEWDDSGATGELRWYVDGQRFHSISETDLPADTWADMTSHAGYFILLNLAMGGAFPDGVAGQATPVAGTEPGHSLLVDYVRVHTRGGGDPEPEPTTTEPTTSEPSEPGDGRDAYSRIEAESFDAENGVGVEATSDSGGGENLGWIGDGDWVRFDEVDFGSSAPADFVARVASGAGAGVSGLVEVRIDSRSSEPIGSFAVGDTGGWQSWQSIPGNVSAVTGTHTVYLTFTSGQPDDFVNVNWFNFRR